jgi:hypothetical protein
MDKGHNAQNTSSGVQPSTVVYIEELVLHGVTPSDRYRIGNAVQRELARLFVEQGAPDWLSQSGEVERLDGGAFKMRPGSRPEEIGAQIAHAIYGGSR